MAFSSESKPLRTRLKPLLQALRGLQSDQTFSRGIETRREYLQAAKELMARGFTCIVFGHTHLAKHIQLDGGVYINTGTWADLMRIPKDILTGSKEDAEKSLLEFCHALDQRTFSHLVDFVPTYARLDLDSEGHVLTAELLEYNVAKTGVRSTQ